MILKHDFKCEISWLPHSECFSVTCCLKCSECGSDIRVEAAVRARDEDWIVIGCNEKRVWVLEIKTCDGQLSLIEQLADAFRNRLDLGVRLVHSKLCVVERRTVFSLAR